MALSQYKLNKTRGDVGELIGGAAITGQYGNGFGTAQRYDLQVKNSLKEAEEYVLGIHGDDEVKAQLADKTLEEPVLVSLVNAKQGNIDATIAAYFYNFRVAPILPEDRGNNYVTTTVKDNVSSSNTVAYAIRNDTGSSVTGSQSISTSTTYSLSSSINGSESYSYAESIKYGGGYEFPVAVKLSIELGFTATQTISAGWSMGQSVSNTESNSQNVSVTLPPYTSVLLTTKTTEAEYESRYNCPVALVYDVILVGYDIHRAKDTDPIPYTMFTFKDQTGGARANALSRSQLPETYTDDDGVAWTGDHEFLQNLKFADYYCPVEVLDYVTSYVPMASTGATFRDSGKAVSSEVNDFRLSLS